jgi:glycosyltransferase involved in cell wall biosynthesis
MRILIVLTYYRPHISGLTIYAERLAKALVKRGHQVTVLTSRYLKELPSEEMQDGLRIVRAPVLFRLSKGVVMPTFGFLANRLVLENDVIHLHLPQFDAAGIALRGRLLKKPTVITYHCDLLMPPGVMAWAANQGVLIMNSLAAMFTHRIVYYTRDYADHSPFIRNHIQKLHVIPPPVELPVIPGDSILSFEKENNPNHQRPVIGIAARFATEKGIEVLLKAMPAVLNVYPNALVQFAGPYQNIIGEEKYFERLKPLIEKYEKEEHWRFVGTLRPEKMAAFFPNLDILVLPSLNSTESFGLVQIEAMINGVPSVASDLPGVRQPVLTHGMGKIIPIGNSTALAQAILAILADPQAYRKEAEPIALRYQPDTIASDYEILFSEIQSQLRGQ